MQPVYVNRKGIAHTEDAPDSQGIPGVEVCGDQTKSLRSHEQVYGACRQPRRATRNLCYGRTQYAKSASPGDTFDQFMGALVLPAIAAGLMVLLAVLV